MFWNSVLCIEVNINEVVKIFQGSVPFYPGQLSRAILCEYMKGVLAMVMVTAVK